MMDWHLSGCHTIGGVGDKTGAFFFSSFLFRNLLSFGTVLPM